MSEAENVGSVPPAHESGTDHTPGRGGRGRGRSPGRGRGGRGHQRKNRGKGGGKTGPTFLGNTDGMKGNVFQCHGENANKQQFTKTVGVLNEHINKTFTFPEDVASVCQSFTVVLPVQPSNLTKKEYEEDMGKLLIWQTRMKTYLKRVDMQESNTRSIYAIVWGQSSP